jgi:phosphoglucosamine mutase
MDDGLGQGLAAPDKLGRAKRIDDAQARYVELAKGTLRSGSSLEGLKVVIDCANGAAYRVAPLVLWELGAEVIPIGVEPNGFNVNKDCGSTSPQAMCAAVREHGADVGIALDGDADRLVIADEHGTLVDGDQIMAVIASRWARKGRLAKNTVVATSMSNLGFEKYLGSQNIDLIRTDVGDRYVVQEMREHGYNLGGEQSGHIVMSDYTTTGDGLIAGLQVLAEMVRDGKPVSEICHLFEAFPQYLENVRFQGGSPLETVAVKAAIAGGEKALNGKGRLVIRKSGTEPLIRVMGEGEDDTLVRQVIGDVVAAVEKASARA